MPSFHLIGHLCFPTQYSPLSVSIFAFHVHPSQSCNFINPTLLSHPGVLSKQSASWIILSHSPRNGNWECGFLIQGSMKRGEDRTAERHAANKEGATPLIC